MDPIRTLVADDEPEAREGILALVRDDPEIEVVGQACTGSQAAALLARLQPELLFLDIQMPEQDGLTVLTNARGEALPVVVFVTAYDEYALGAFEVHALDYLLKPFSDARFAEALALAKARVRQRRIGELGQELSALLQCDAAPRVGRLPEGQVVAAPKYLERLLVPTSRGAALVRVTEIDWVEAADYYAKLHVGPGAYLLRETMERLEAKLDPHHFVRVHRSAIVNIDRVQSLEPYFRGAHVLILHDGTRLPLSRSRKATFERVVGRQL